MSVEWIVTGVILLSAMAAGGISLYIKRRREAQDELFEATNIELDPADPKDEE